MKTRVQSVRAQVVAFHLRTDAPAFIAGPAGTTLITVLRTVILILLSSPAPTCPALRDWRAIFWVRGRRDASKVPNADCRHTPSLAGRPIKSPTHAPSSSEEFDNYRVVLDRHDNTLSTASTCRAYAGQLPIAAGGSGERAEQQAMSHNPSFLETFLAQALGLSAISGGDCDCYVAYSQVDKDLVAVR
jgi:hypothetical protein